MHNRWPYRIRRSSEFVDAVVRAAADTPDLADPPALAEEFDEFLGEKPVSDWSVFNLCGGIVNTCGSGCFRRPPFRLIRPARAV